MAKTKSKIKHTAKVSGKHKNGGFFSGRLSRRGFFIGTLIILAVTVAGFLLLHPLYSLIADRVISSRLSMFLVSIILLLNIFYCLSFCTRRLHDLNRNNYWLLFLTPGLYILLLTIMMTLSAALLGKHAITNLLFDLIKDQQGAWLVLLALLNALTSFLGVYLAAWPGNKKANKYGPEPKHETLITIFGFIK